MLLQLLLILSGLLGLFALIPPSILLHCADGVAVVSLTPAHVEFFSNHLYTILQAIERLVSLLGPSAHMTTFDMRWTVCAHTSRLLKSSCDHFMQVRQYLFVTDVPNRDDKFEEGALYISRPGAEPWGVPKWRQADFPSGEGAKSQHFTVVDSSENEVVVAVLHTETDVRGIGTMTVSNVPAIAEAVPLSRALFSELLPASTTPMELTLIFDPENPKGCPENGTLTVWDAFGIDSRPFAFVVRRGSCKFVEKLQLAYDAGASGVVVVNYDDTENIFMVCVNLHGGRHHPVGCSRGRWRGALLCSAPPSASSRDSALLSFADVHSVNIGW